MFERFTDSARKVMAVANQEAQRFNHERIGPEHILLGLVRVDNCAGACVLKNLDVDLRKVRLEVEKLLEIGPDMVLVGKQPNSPQAKKVIEYAIAERRILNDPSVDTDNLLIGLLSAQDSVAARVLIQLGVKLDVVRKEALNLRGCTGSGDTPLASQPLSLESEERVRWAGGIMKTILAANQMARDLRHDRMGVEHLFLVLLSEKDGVVAKSLTNLGLNPEQVREEVLKLMADGKKSDDVK